LSALPVNRRDPSVQRSTTASQRVSGHRNGIRDGNTRDVAYGALRLPARNPPANSNKTVENAMSQALATDAARARTPSVANR
jgi:hypothetical protein